MLWLQESDPRADLRDSSLAAWLFQNVLHEVHDHPRPCVEEHHATSDKVIFQSVGQAWQCSQQTCRHRRNRDSDRVCAVDSHGCPRGVLVHQRRPDVVPTRTVQKTANNASQGGLHRRLEYVSRFGVRPRLGDECPKGWLRFVSCSQTCRVSQSSSESVPQFDVSRNIAIEITASTGIQRTANRRRRGGTTCRLFWYGWRSVMAAHRAGPRKPADKERPRANPHTLMHAFMLTGVS